MGVAELGCNSGFGGWGAGFGWEPVAGAVRPVAAPLGYWATWLGLLRVLSVLYAALLGGGGVWLGLGGGLGVEVLGEVLWGDGGVDAGGGDFAVGGPDDGVEDELALVGVAPTLMEVASGEAEAAAAVGAFNSPGDVLWEPCSSLLHARRRCRCARRWDGSWCCLGLWLRGWG